MALNSLEYFFWDCVLAICIGNLRKMGITFRVWTLCKGESEHPAKLVYSSYPNLIYSYPIGIDRDEVDYNKTISSVGFRIIGLPRGRSRSSLGMIH
jgi:hypothetical protein